MYETISVDSTKYPLIENETTHNKTVKSKLMLVKQIRYKTKYNFVQIITHDKLTSYAFLIKKQSNNLFVWKYIFCSSKMAFVVDKLITWLLELYLGVRASRLKVFSHRAIYRADLFYVKWRIHCVICEKSSDSSSTTCQRQIAMCVWCFENLGNHFWILNIKKYGLHWCHVMLNFSS